MPNRTEACSAKAALTNATGRLPLLRLFSTPLVDPVRPILNERNRLSSTVTRLNGGDSLGFCSDKSMMLID
jgi:hypothetical protein